MKIIHVLRAPIGGLFRHVLDLAAVQVRLGHQVGMIADSQTGNARTAAQIAELEPILALGIHRFPMHRSPRPSDIVAQLRVNAIVRRLDADIVHGHGSKGGLYARIPGLARFKGQSHRPLRVYTPHGGSLNYYPGSMAHSAYMLVERLLERASDLLLFESQFVADRYFQYVSKTKRPHQVFFNGLLPHELEPVRHREDAADFMFIGELRRVKGVDIILSALAKLRAELGRPLRLEIFGTGPDEAALRQQAKTLRLDEAVRFNGAVPARQAFESGRIMVLGSTFESMPYVVLEAAGCAQPLISTNVGGIPEIFGDCADALIEAGNVDALKEAMREALIDPAALKARAERVRARVAASFSVEIMAATIEAAYQRAMMTRLPAASLATAN